MTWLRLTVKDPLSDPMISLCLVSRSRSRYSPGLRSEREAGSPIWNECSLMELESASAKQS